MPSNVTITWRGDDFMRAIVPAIDAGLTAAALVMANQATINFGTEGGGVIGADISPLAGGKRLYRHRIKKRSRYYPSPPGAFPGVRTSLLRNSIAAASPASLGTPGRAAFGTSVRYGRWLELGTSRMPARPWIVRSALEARPLAARVFARAAAKVIKAEGRSM